ncbi:MAG TPA: hypothetical protein VE934_09155 [Polaromonas sp.]|uniref:hypothetical protein n=1 Tax=Polaromonas sp. TaxID=1869339 RepID=UPI002D5AD8B9|nr:hypothetical protein [Polaromonas sp.]HYW57117.1 hypothetical protein [Polaromonas sp.]
MNATTHPISEQVREHDQAFNTSFTAARQLRDRDVKVRPHRSISPLKVTPWLLIQGIVLPLIFCGLLLTFKPQLLEFWRECILFWSRALDLPFGLSTRLNQAGQYALRLSGNAESGAMPSTFNVIVTTVITLIILALTFRMNNAKLPLKYPLRIAAVVQLFTLAYFWFSPSDFPYTIARHSEELMTIGYVVMLSTPVMLAVGYYILNQSLVLKVFHTILILAFFVIMVPHQVLVQAFIMQHLSVLFMPLLYICFGAVFDALVFVALYSWAVSSAPEDATI